MKKFFKRLFIIILCLAIAFVAVRFGPYLYARLFGGGNTRWISEQLSETLREKNELIVYEVETTGRETVSQDAWILGTVQKVEMPYTFQMSYIVDLSGATVTLKGNTIEIGVPKPVAAYHKLTADDANMKKSDFFYPLTPERYADIKNQVEKRLFEEYRSKDEYVKNAWESTVKNLETLFKSVAERSEQGVTCDVSIVEITPAPATEAPGEPSDKPAELPTATPAA